jgi:hypothetical protein
VIFHTDPDAQIPTFETRTCEFHKAHPGEPYAGCCCMTSFGVRTATPEEQTARKHARLEKRRTELLDELRSVNAQLEGT